ncbi:methyltransferase [Streptomyces sp. NPDC007083]|uniref:methyltransferase n=1 Tax=unclassified Streptomyces TaxID=2593676 RepID=UPI0033F7CE41
MTTDPRAAEQAAMSGLLSRLHQSLHGPLAPEWEAAFHAVPRHAFLPDTVWLGDDLAPCNCQDDFDAWLRAAYDDAPVVTQINDGHAPGPEDDRWPSCSASAPSIVFRMLDMLDLEGGERVLEVGTGTGWNAGLLAHRLGTSLVTTVEVDTLLADQARANLEAVGLSPHVITGDGAVVADRAVDRIVATCSVRQVPRRWVSGVAPGGVILLPWESPWLCYGLLRLTVQPDGPAVGRFHPHSAFMLMRGQRTDLRIFRDVVRDDHIPTEFTSALSPWAVSGDNWAAQFAIGLQLPDVWCAWHHNPDVDGVETRLWVATTDATSWAAVDHDGKTDDAFAVWEHGPRRLWSEVEAAYHWWTEAGQPGPERFGMTVTCDGAHQPWLDDPERPVPRRVQGQST